MAFSRAQPWTEARREPAPGLYVVPERVRGPYPTVVKRGVDIVVSGTALLVLSPVVLGVAVAVRLRQGSPVLFRQRRVGRDGRVFEILKFRTMLQDRRTASDRRAERRADIATDRRRTHKSDTDPRHTDLGRVLRRTSLDELPQLWNVLRGDMSLIGPRPELVQIVDRYEPWQHRRHAVRPGLTGLWQVSARGGRPMHEVTHIDLEYVDGLSLRTDLAILWRTPAALLRRSGS